MTKTAAKKPAKQARASKVAKKAPPAKSAPAVKEAARPEAARGKLERVKVPPPSRRDDDSSGKYVYCVIRSEQPLKFGPLGLGPEPAEVHTIPYLSLIHI